MQPYRSDDLELLITLVARQEAQRESCPLSPATRQTRQLVAAVRLEYQAAGAPFGDHDHGFCRWLLAPLQIIPTA